MTKVYKCEMCKYFSFIKGKYTKKTRAGFKVCICPKCGYFNSQKILLGKELQNEN